MGYSTIAECDLILAQALTSAKPETPSTQRVKLINIGTTRDFNRVPNDTVEFYITLADSQIDGELTQMYFTPFNKCAHGEWALDEDINLGIVGGTDSSGMLPLNSSIKTIVVTSSCNLVPGEEIVIHDNSNGNEEIHIVSSIIDQNTFMVADDIIGTFLASTGVRIIRQRFPPPLNQISARLAASFIYDKFFAAQADPNISDYGKEMRKIAAGQINDILNGRIIIKCGKRRGDISGNPWLDSTYGLRKPYNGFDEGRNMSNFQ